MAKGGTTGGTLGQGRRELHCKGRTEMTVATDPQSSATVIAPHYEGRNVTPDLPRDRSKPPPLIDPDTGMLTEFGRRAYDLLLPGYRKWYREQMSRDWKEWEYWTSHGCAEFLGIAESTWRAYVSRKQAPQPEPPDPRRSAPARVWRSAVVKEWARNRKRRPVD